MGLFSSGETRGYWGGNLLDTLCGRLTKLLSFKEGERDLVVLQHKSVLRKARWALSNGIFRRLHPQRCDATSP